MLGATNCRNQSSFMVLQQISVIQYHFRYTVKFLTVEIGLGGVKSFDSDIAFCWSIFFDT